MGRRTREQMDRRNAWEREWRVKNRERSRAYFREYARMWRRKNPASAKASEDRWRERNPDKIAAKSRRRALKVRYSWTVAQYEAMLAAQKGLCAICRSDSSGSRGKRLFVDHDHATNKTRSLLCHRCNSMLGMALDDPARLRAAADYLDAHRS